MNVYSSFLNLIHTVYIIIKVGNFQNISVYDFCLSDSEMSELATLDRGENGRVCDFTFFIGADKHPEFPFKK